MELMIRKGFVVKEVSKSNPCPCFHLSPKMRHCTFPRLGLPPEVLRCTSVEWAKSSVLSAWVCLEKMGDSVIDASGGCILIAFSYHLMGNRNKNPNRMAVGILHYAEECNEPTDIAKLFCRSAVMQAESDQLGNIGLAYTHDRIRTAPINLHRSIRLGNRAAGKDNVVDIPCYFPGIFRL
jgi:hypothetical protein